MSKNTEFNKEARSRSTQNTVELGFSRYSSSSKKKEQKQKSISKQNSVLQKICDIAWKMLYDCIQKIKKLDGKQKRKKWKRWTEIEV